MNVMVKRPKERLAPQHIMQVRGANRALMLQILRKHPKLSRAELARRTGLSEGTISRIASELLNERLILEQGAEKSTGGRPGLRLELDQTYLRSVGAEIHEWETRVSIGTLLGQVIETERFRTPSSPTATLDAIADHVHRALDRFGRERLRGVGVSARGIVDNVRGVVDVGSIPEWNGVPIKQYLEEKLDIPVYVENNVRAATLAEYSYGNSEIHNSRCMLLVKIDEGVGMGIILDGKLYRGPHRAAGEFGQMVIADSPGGGAQDRPGCLESLVSNPAILARYAALSKDKRTRYGDTERRMSTVCHLAMQGDPAAVQAVREAMRFLGIGIANVVWGLNPDVVLINGVITEAWPLVVTAIQEQFPAGPEFRPFRDLILRPCSLGQDAGIVGALTLPFVTLFASGHFDFEQKSAAAGK